MEGSAKSEGELCTRYREMSMQPECDSAIDDIVTNTKFNTISMLGNSDITFTVGSTIDGSNQLSITIGGISSIASVTAASSATSTSNTLSTTLGTVQGQVTGGVTSSSALSNVNASTSAVLEQASLNIEAVDYAVETAKLTKNILLNKIFLIVDLS